jgi:hypothetical protein
VKGLPEEHGVRLTRLSRPVAAAEGGAWDTILPKGWHAFVAQFTDFACIFLPPSIYWHVKRSFWLLVPLLLAGRG